MSAMIRASESDRTKVACPACAALAESPCLDGCIIKEASDSWPQEIEWGTGSWSTTLCTRWCRNAEGYGVVVDSQFVPDADGRKHGWFLNAPAGMKTCQGPSMPSGWAAIDAARRAMVRAGFVDMR